MTGRELQRLSVLGIFVMFMFGCAGSQRHQGPTNDAGQAIPSRDVEGTVSLILPFVADDGRLQALGIILSEDPKACYAISIEKAVECALVDEEIAASGLRGHSINRYGGISGPGIHGHGERVKLSVRDSMSTFGTSLEIVSLEWQRPR